MSIDFRGIEMIVPQNLLNSPDVHAVLQQFPEEDVRAFIQVVGQHVQHTAQIYLKMIV